MLFPFTFNFSVPGILNPFAKVVPPPNPLSQTAREQENDTKRSRSHLSPTIDSCQSTPNSNRRSQGALDYRDRHQHQSAPAYPSTSTSHPIRVPSTNRLSRAHLPKIERRPSPSPSSSTSNSLRALPLSRKRGWEPAFGAEGSLTPGQGKTGSTTSLTFASSSGYLDTPAKYRDIADDMDITMSDDHYRENEQREEGEDDAPPLKKRRGLAGSIVSTAVSAALIGTAVGLTVYRLWRDRGKEGHLTQPSASSSSTPSDTEQAPPPPYDAGAWKPIEQPPAIPVARSLPTTPATPRSGAKSRKAVPIKRAVGGHHHHSSSGSTRRARARYGGGAGAGGAVVGSPRTRPEFDFGRAEVEDRRVEQESGMGQVEDQMDWIGDKLSALIEQGRRALQSEVVVMSEAKEDEVDDGRGGWEEENSHDDGNGDDDAKSTRSRRSRAGSVRGTTKPRPRSIVPPPPVGLGFHGVHTSASGSISASPRVSGFGFAPSAPGSAYATPSTSYTPAAGGFVSSSVPSPHRINGHVRGISYESALPSTPGVTVVQEDAAAWESPELRESMERARARLLARRGGA